VIALDYGTTFTGFCYAVEGTGDQNHLFLSEQWPTRPTASLVGRAGSQKVPSRISYSPAPNGEHQWGFDIAPGSLEIMWTKLELDDQNIHEELSMILQALDAMEDFDPAVIEREDGLPPYPALDPVDIAADYLRYVREYVRDHPPRNLSTAVLTTLPIDLVVTVPAIWSDRAKNRTIQAISRAGFDTTNFPRLQDIFLVAEPEAAALYTITTQFEIEGSNFMDPGDIFVLCDAGGGTVDLISYRVMETTPSIQLSEATLGSGDRCGATFIDRKFMEWLERKLGREYFSRLNGGFPEWDIGSHYTVGPDLELLMHEFENLREQFVSPDDQTEAFLTLPVSLRGTEPAGSLHNGELRITGRDLEEMFEPCVTRVVDLVSGQIGQLSEFRARIKYVFLTGGFGQSQYLYAAVERLTSRLGIQTKLPGPLEPHRRNEQRKHCWSAVVRGAALRGLERGHPNLIQMRLCRQCYGISISEPFSSFKHLERDAYYDLFDGQRKARGQMNWLLKTGDALPSLPSNESCHASTKFRTKFGQNDPRIFTICLVVLDGVTAHQRYADITPGNMATIEIRYDLGTDLNRFQTIQPSGRETYFYADLELELKLETHLIVQIKFQGQTITRYP